MPAVFVLVCFPPTIDRHCFCLLIREHQPLRSARRRGSSSAGGVYGERALMCGIVGYVGPREAADVVIGGLQRLEYRGYDSAGIAIVDRGDLAIRRSVGKLANLKTKLHEKPTRGHQGIGHTRWATHGGVTENNAHPHRSQSGDGVVIQNGIVENYLQLKQELACGGYRFDSQTDTEVIAHLVERETAGAGSFCEGFGRAMLLLKGGNAVVAMSVREPGLILAARLGNAGAVVIGDGDGE